MYAVSNQAALLLISRFATCDQNVAAFSKLKLYIVMQGAEFSRIVSTMLKRSGYIRIQKQSARIVRLHGHDDKSGILTTPDFLFRTCRRPDSANDCFFRRQDSHGLL